MHCSAGDILEAEAQIYTIPPKMLLTKTVVLLKSQLESLDRKR